VFSRGDSVTLPETRYAKSGDTRIAYQVIGHGALDLVFVPGFISNLDLQWEDPGYSRLLRRLSAFARVIQFDQRGGGLSDRVDADRLPSLAERMEDIRAVMDATGSMRAVLLGASEGAALAVLFAVTYPSRTRALVLHGGYAHFHSGVMAREAFDELIEKVEGTWGSGASLPLVAPGRARDARFQAWWARFERLSASPTAAVALARMNAQIDVRDRLQAVTAPTVVIHRREDVWAKFSAGRQLAQKIAGARFVELSGRDHLIWIGEIDRVADEIEEFVTGVRPAPSHHRVLVTVLVARLVAAEQLARRLGDGRWREHLDQFRNAATGTIARFGGELAPAGAEEICARFDGPARAVACAIALRDAAAALELRLAVGVHIGEVEIHDGALSGYALHVTERISTYANAGQVLVSGVVGDLVSGTGFHFVEHPVGRLAEGDDRLRLLSVMVEQHLEPAARPARTPSLDALSQREREVLALVADGLSNAAIAEQLNLSEHTAKRHVANILVKLDLPTRAAAAAMVARQRAG
jgi:pimeloyl-ACP methyl ester carboxylesterase/DNA-binding CsgD family transcriptional regulator